MNTGTTDRARRFHALVAGARLHVESEVDRFARGRPIALREDLSGIRFRLESANPTTHTSTVRLTGLPAGAYRVTSDGEVVADFRANEGAATAIDVPVEGEAGSGTIAVARVP